MAKGRASLTLVTAAAVLGLAAAGATGTPPTRAATAAGPRCAKLPLERRWRPDMRAAIAYARTRQGDISFAVRSEHRFDGYRPDHVVPSASVVKAMLLVAYLDMPSVSHRALNGSDYALITPMIERSDNNAATAVRDIVGNGRLAALASRVGMRHFATNPVWGLTRVTADDQTRFFLHIDSFVVARHRSVTLGLLASVTPSQRWGIGQVRLRGWTLYFKGGWGSGTGAVDHQVALLVRGCDRLSVAVMTLGDGTHDYGKETLRAIFARLLRGLPGR
jgi:Beta-lactamase enzyme family